MCIRLCIREISPIGSQVGLSENIEMQIDFFDMTGQKKLSKIFKTPLLINRSEFSPGIYSFCIKVDPLNIITGKIAIY